MSLDTSSAVRYTLTKMVATLYRGAVDMRIREMDPELSRRLKAIAALDGQTMNEKVIELLWKAVKQDTRVKPTSPK